MTTEIRMSNIRKYFSDGKIQALNGINLEIAKGDFFALIGPNGAGKTTLVRVLTGLAQKDKGEFFIGDKNKENNFFNLQQYIGVVSQQNELDPTETVKSHLEFQAGLYSMSRKKAKERSEELIDHFMLNSEKDKKVRALSGGNKRRLHCALALVHNPEVLFLDEPTVGMDPLARSSFWEIITGLNSTQGTSIFLTSQYLDEVDKYANNMALIMEGEIHFSGTVKAFKKDIDSDQDSSLEDSYIEYVKALEQKEIGGDNNAISQ